MRFAIDVPYAEKDEAKGMGARWDPAGKTWYVGQSDHPARQHWPSPLAEFPGEDRSFGGSMLFVDLVPRSCWFTNARSALSPSDWQRVRNLAGGRTGWACETCGAKGTCHIHERWAFLRETQTQSLRRLIALCANCHLATHFGFAEISGKRDVAARQLASINHWSMDQVDEHVDRAFGLWRRRNEIDWKLDLGILTDAGLTIIKPAPVASRAEMAAAALESVRDDSLSL